MVGWLEAQWNKTWSARMYVWNNSKLHRMFYVLLIVLFLPVYLHFELFALLNRFVVTHIPPASLWIDDQTQKSLRASAILTDQMLQHLSCAGGDEQIRRNLAYLQILAVGAPNLHPEILKIYRDCSVPLGISAVQAIMNKQLEESNRNEIEMLFNTTLDDAKIRARLGLYDSYSVLLFEKAVSLIPDRQLDGQSPSIGALHYVPLYDEMFLQRARDALKAGNLRIASEEYMRYFDSLRSQDKTKTNR